MINNIDVDRHNIKRLIVLFFNTNKHQYSIRLKNSDTISSCAPIYSSWELQHECSESVNVATEFAWCVPIHYKERTIITFIRDKSFTKIIVNKIIRHPAVQWSWVWVKYSKLIINKNGYFNFDTL